jgi:hypothetical protein
MSEFNKKFGLVFPQTLASYFDMQEKRLTFILLKFGVRDAETARRVVAEFYASCLRQSHGTVNSAALLVSILRKQADGKLIHTKDGDELLPDWA